MNKIKKASYKGKLTDAFRCGRGGIRTPGGVTHAGFQDRCIKPALPLFQMLSLKATQK